MSVRDTSAIPVGLRSRVPAKITSSMRAPRRVRADCSPKTHEIASATFDLPQPFGPTMAAMPSPWNLSSFLSQKDLNPRICSFLSLSTPTPEMTPANMTPCCQKATNHEQIAKRQLSWKGTDATSNTVCGPQNANTAQGTRRWLKCTGEPFHGQ